MELTLGTHRVSVGGGLVEAEVLPGIVTVIVISTIAGTGRIEGIVRSALPAATCPLLQRVECGHWRLSYQSCRRPRRAYPGSAELKEPSRDMEAKGEASYPTMTSPSLRVRCGHSRVHVPPACESQ